MRLLLLYVAAFSAIIQVSMGGLLEDYTLAEMEDFIPEQSPSRCDQIRLSPAVDYAQYPDAQIDWSWDSTRPNELLETNSGQVFPDSAYTVKTRMVESHSGGQVALKYTVGIHPQSASVKPPRCIQGVCEPPYSEGIYLEGCLAEKKIGFFYSTILKGLSQEYNAQDPTTERYARRILELLDSWANKFPNYVFRICNTLVVMTKAQCNAYRGSGSIVTCSLLSHYNGQAHELDRVPLEVYQKVKGSQAATTLSAERGYNVLSHIVEKIFRVEADYFLPGGGGQPLETLILGNLIGWAPKFISLGKELGDGKYALFLVDYLSGASGQAGRDGLVMESFMYGQHASAGLLTALNELESYYSQVPPAPGSPDAQGLAKVSIVRALLDRGQRLLFDLQLPNNQWPANGDNNREGFRSTDGYITVAGRNIAAARSNSSALAPAYGHVALRAHAEGSQINIDYASAGGYHHMPNAILSLQLSAFGRQLLDHFRYERTRLRNRNGCTSAWNVVSINQKSQWPTTIDDDVTPHATQSQGARHPPLPFFSSRNGADYMAKGGDVLFFHPGSEGISAIEIDGYRAYYPWTAPGDYQRFVLHVERDPQHPFTIDIFRTKGGLQHEFNLHGSTMMNMEVSSSATVPLSGTRPLLRSKYGSWTSPPWKQGWDPDDPRWYGQFVSVNKRNSASSNASVPLGIFSGLCDGSESPACPTGSRLADAPSLKIWTASLEDDGTKTETFFTQTPHNFRATYPSDSSPVDPAAFKAATLITRRSSINSTHDDEPSKSKRDPALESLFVHVYEPKDPSIGGDAGIASVEQIELKSVDRKSVGLKVTQRDGRSAVLLVRLTPGTDGHESTLPLAHPVLQKVETSDGRYRLEGGSHFGLWMEASDATLRVLAGPSTSRHIDGVGVIPNQGAGVFEGVVTDIAKDENGDYLVVSSNVGLPLGMALADRWLTLSLGSYRISSPVQGVSVANDVRAPLRVREVEKTFSGETRVRLANPLHMKQMADPESPSATCLVEQQRPGRWFCGPQERSFRIVGVATDVKFTPSWVSAPFPSCPSACGSPLYKLSRRVYCRDPATGCELDGRACRSGRPATSKVCPETEQCAFGRFLKIKPAHGGRFRFLKEVEVFALGTTPQEAFAEGAGVSNNALGLSNGGLWALDGRYWTLGTSSSASSIRSPVMASGRSNWGDPSLLLDRDTSASLMLITEDGNCEIVIDLGESMQVGVARVLGSESDLEMTLLRDNGAGSPGTVVETVSATKVGSNANAVAQVNFGASVGGGGSPVEEDAAWTSVLSPESCSTLPGHCTNLIFQGTTNERLLQKAKCMKGVQNVSDNFCNSISRPPTCFMCPAEDCDAGAPSPSPSRSPLPAPSPLRNSPDEGSSDSRARGGGLGVNVFVGGSVAVVFLVLSAACFLHLRRKRAGAGHEHEGLGEQGRAEVEVAMVTRMKTNPSWNRPAQLTSTAQNIGGWKELLDENTGRSYWWHQESGATQWEKPNGEEEDELKGKERDLNLKKKFVSATTEIKHIGSTSNA